MTFKKTIRFENQDKDSFLKELRKEIENHFILNEISKEAPWPIHLKTTGLITIYLFTYITLLNDGFPAIPRLIIWLFFGVIQALIAVNIGHDALHGSYFKSSFANKMLGFLAYDCLGLSSYIWKQTHNREHHTFTNITGLDPDIDKPGILRLSPHSPYYNIHKFQHLYVWFLYSLVTLNWVFYSDYLYFWKVRKGMPKVEKFLFFSFKVLNIFIILGLPLFLSSMTWQIFLAGIFLMHFSAGLTVSIIFQLAHVVENVEFPLPNEQGDISTPWGTHEMRTTSNFATSSLWVTHLVGGLNFQIEHHLFPKVSHFHYPKLSKIVRDIVKKHNLPYYEYKTTKDAIISHARFLKKLGNRFLNYHH